MKSFKFIWSNEDAAFILGGVLGLLQINFDTTNAMMPLAIGMILKGLMSMFSVTLGNDASEDIMLIIGAVTTLVGIHFNYQNPLFALTIGAIIKAGFGIFGVSIPVPGAPGAPKVPMLFWAVLISFMAFAGPAFCDGWTLPAESFNRHFNSQYLKLGTPTGTIDGDFIPTASIGYGVGGSNPSYGLSLGDDFVIGTVTTVDALHVIDSPIIGLGGAFYFDAGPWLNSNMSSPILIDGAINLIGPTLEGIVPGIERSWNFNTGEMKTQLILSTPFALLESVIVPIFGQ